MSLPPPRWPSVIQTPPGRVFGRSRPTRFRLTRGRLFGGVIRGGGGRGDDLRVAAVRRGEGTCAQGSFARMGSMRFAFKTAPQNTTWPDMLAVWKEADDIEIFESVWTFDHFYPIFSDSAGPCLEGWMTLAALAQATRRRSPRRVLAPGGLTCWRRGR